MTLKINKYTFQVISGKVFVDVELINLGISLIIWLVILDRLSFANNDSFFFFVLLEIDRSGAVLNI